jgi:hypothetical protein
MTFADLLPQLMTLTYQDAKTKALVFGAEAYAALMNAQQHRHSQHRVAPARLSDGRWLLSADLLTEIGTGGIYSDGFALLSPEALALVDVVEWADAVALLPQPDAEPQLVRARDADGRFISDDPATPDVDEAWVDVSQ